MISPDSAIQRPCVEILEARRLLSAATPVPVLTGAPYVGTAIDSRIGPEALTITITAERKSGAVSGTLVAAAAGQTFDYTFTGSVNRRGVLVLHARGGSHRTVTVNGTVGAGASTISGKYVAHSRRNSSHGTFFGSR